MELKGKVIVEAGHITEVYGPVQALRNWLIPRTDEFYFITHPFSYSKLEGSTVTSYKNGFKDAELKGHRRSGNRFEQWVKDAFFNMRFLASF
ncbi:MAG: hypothetical protein LLG37_11060, partial [Spirochaetia bacterium]|nr:hypothetical protein [Spirochaetia bacterium]